MLYLVQMSLWGVPLADFTMFIKNILNKESVMNIDIWTGSKNMSGMVRNDLGTSLTLFRGILSCWFVLRFILGGID